MGDQKFRSLPEAPDEAGVCVQGWAGGAVSGRSKEVRGMGPVCWGSSAAGKHAEQPHEHSQRHPAGPACSGRPPERAQGFHQDLRGGWPCTAFSPLQQIERRVLEVATHKGG